MGRKFLLPRRISPKRTENGCYKYDKTYYQVKDCPMCEVDKNKGLKRKNRTEKKRKS